MKVLHVQEARGRPHLHVDCWCNPSEDDQFVYHRMIDVRPDVQPRMAVFTHRDNPLHV